MPHRRAALAHFIVQRRHHVDAWQLAILADEGFAVPAAIEQQHVRDPGNPLRGQFGDRALGQGDVGGDRNPDQDVARAVAIETDIGDLADADPAVADLRLGLEAADAEPGDNDILAEVVVGAA